MMFERPHHRRILHVLQVLDASRLRQLQCWFGGGTAIALRHGEYRESVDIDFLISNRDGYRELRQSLSVSRSLAPILTADAPGVGMRRELRADQYGIRTTLEVEGTPIKFEIVLEGRIEFEQPGAGTSWPELPRCR